MRTVISIASVLVCACSLNAQIVGRVNRLPDSRDQVMVRNNSTKSLLAFAVSVNHTPSKTESLNGPLVIFSDALIDVTATPLQTGEERVVRMTGIPPGMFAGGLRLLGESIVTAGILADGTTTGDTILLGRLIIRRSNMLQAVETAMGVLQDAGKRNIPRDQIIQQFQRLADSVSHWYLPPEQHVRQGLYQSIVGTLINLPEQQTGSPFPPTDFVAQEIEVLSRQRVRLLESEPSLQEAAVLIGR
jgi:hypothetical protein